MMDAARSCPASADNSFGPWAGPVCRGGFDFTLLFEESILTVPLECIFLLILPWRLMHLMKRKGKVVPSSLRIFKLTSSGIRAVLQLVLVVLWAQRSSAQIRHTRFSIPTAAISFVASLGLVLLSWFEHVNSVRPSFVLDTYLFLSIIFDSARARTLWLINEDRVIPVVFTCTIAIRCAMLVLESTEKRSILKPAYKEYPPEAISGSFNRSVFWWLSTLFFRGYGRVLSADDLFPLDKQLYSERLQDRFQKTWQNVLDQKKKNALFGAWIRTQLGPILLPIISRLLAIGFTFAQPFMVSRAILLASSPNLKEFNNIGYGLIGAYAFVYIGIGVSEAQYEYAAWRAATKMRGCLVPSVFRKTLHLKLTDANPSSALTLITTDIETLTHGIVQLHEIWACPIEIAVAMYLLNRQLGAACAVPISFAIFTMICTGAIAVFIAPAQAAWIKASEQRVAKTASTINNIKWLKLSGLTDAAFSVIEAARKHELAVSKKYRQLMVYIIALATISPIIAPMLSFLTFILLSHDDNALTISKAFTSLSLFSLLGAPLAKLVIALPSFATMFTCFQRLQDYLNLEPWEDRRLHSIPHEMQPMTEYPASNSPLSPEDEIELAGSVTTAATRLADNVIAFIDGQFRWSEDGSSGITIKDWEIRKGTFNLVFGPVGCGKSTYIKCLLGELQEFKGTLQTAFQNVAFCDQAPWLPNGSVRDLILGTSDFDMKWYQQVKEACDLEEDIQQWPQGDSSVTGSKGISLSGGQKQRLALARAVYSRSELIILDDCFSGLDTRTSNSVFHALLGSEGLLRKDNVTVILTSSDTHRAQYTDQLVVIGADGTMLDQGSFAALKSRGNDVSAMLLQAEVQQSQRTQAAKETTATSSEDAVAKVIQSTLPNGVTAAEMNRRTGDISVYKYYFHAIGWLSPLLFTGMMVVYAFCDSFPNFWLKWWSEDPSRHPTGLWLGIYGVLVIGALFSITIAVWELFMVTISNSGLYFHSLLVKTVSNAPMSFFSSVDAGVTVNRFSQDLQLIDMELSGSLFGVATTGSVAVAQAILMAVASKYIAISFPIIILVVYAIQHFYLRTSRQMRFLDIECKAPLYSQLMECLNGLPTIRAFQWEEQLMQQNYQILDNSQRPWYLLNCLQRWLSLAISLMTAAMAITLITLTTTLREQIGPGYAGIALVNVVSFSAVVGGLITTWVNLEISVGAVARTKNFVAEVLPEDQEENIVGERHAPPSTWPENGNIEIQNLSAYYKPGELVLKDINISIKAGEKIGICGRTGSGKSTLISCLFRMLSIEGGRILIDNIDIATLPHESVRTHLIAAPQEPYIFNGTIRLNADPSANCSDEEIISALEKVDLWRSIEPRGGLDAVLESGGDFFSHGQKQLFSLSRAMLRKGNVLILDEVTSSLDDETISQITSLILSPIFASHTILSIAHRLESIMKFDKIIVMDQGQIIEFDEPDTLLANQESAFSRLVNGLERHSS